MKTSTSRRAKPTPRPHQRPRVRQSRVPSPQRAILKKMLDLAPDKVAEVEDFVDFLRQRQDDAQLTRAATKIAETSFAEAWDNPDDAAYDQL
jgi:hypothetical protein